MLPPRFRLLLPPIALVLLVAGLIGCGGGDEEAAEPTGGASQADTETVDVPQPAESAQEYTDRWAAALREGDCEALTEIYGYLPEQVPAACEEVTATLKDIETTGVDQYGPAALVRFEADNSAIRDGAV